MRREIKEIVNEALDSENCLIVINKSDERLDYSSTVEMNPVDDDSL